MGIVTTTYGDVRGCVKDGCEEYLGIPFAKPPVGELAFRRPVRPEPWEGTRDATKGSCNPIQAQHPFSEDNNSEDCLYLNVFVPEMREGPLPVMFWIFGGSYATGGVGYSHERNGLVYELGLFARETNTVVVAVNYRLNLYGFLGMRCLSDRFDTNVGLYDLALALEFVHDNVAAFGGDPNNVTVFGESAGGALTLALMSSQKTSGYFHKAIVQSACVDSFWSMDQARHMAKRYMRCAGLDTRHPNKVLELTHDQARAAATELAQKLVASGEMRCVFSPIIDGDFLTDYPKLLAASAPQQLLIGCVTYDGDLFVDRISDALLRVASIAAHVKVPRGSESYRLRLGEGVTNAVFREPLLQIADAHAHLSDTWRFEYNFASENMRERGLRPRHTCDIFPLFSGADKNGWYDPADPEMVRVGQSMRSLWADMAWSRMSAPRYEPGAEAILIDEQGVHLS
ncbi:MAG: carboxylesterase family protein [Coriobacteriales bacterium]|nr:carboxylesterase family protein [Coriobacteriales bacterium]